MKMAHGSPHLVREGAFDAIHVPLQKCSPLQLRLLYFETVLPYIWVPNYFCSLVHCPFRYGVVTLAILMDILKDEIELAGRPMIDFLH